MNGHELVAYCGLYCGDCLMYKGEIADLSRDLRKAIRSEKKFYIFMKAIPFLRKYDHEQCYETLGALIKLRCKRTCRGGGGNPLCPIRRCCKDKKLNGCWECKDFENCKKLNILVPVHEDAHLKNLRTIKKQGIDKFVGGKRHW